MDRDGFRNSGRSLRIALAARQLDSFQQFEEALYEANRTRNLTRVPREECWTRHFLESLLFHDLIGMGSSVLDIGSGPGFPAWPLACARPDLQVTAMDSNGKMIDFLRSQPLPNLLVVQARAEECQMRAGFDCVTGRAFAPLPIQLEVSAPLVKIGGMVIPMRTDKDYALPSKTLADLGLQLRETRAVPGDAGMRVFPVYEKIAPTDMKYPRRWAEMVRRPLQVTGQTLFEQASL